MWKVAWGVSAVRVAVEEQEEMESRLLRLPLDWLPLLLLLRLEAEVCEGSCRSPPPGGSMLPPPLLGMLEEAEVVAGEVMVVVAVVVAVAAALVVVEEAVLVVVAAVVAVERVRGSVWWTGGWKVSTEYLNNGPEQLSCLSMMDGTRAWWKERAVDFVCLFHCLTSS